MNKGIRHVAEKESFKQFTDRYKIMAIDPSFKHRVMAKTTYKVDKYLLEVMKSLSKHPRDTGLLQESWRLPNKNYFITPKKEWRVHLINIATVSEQHNKKGVSLKNNIYKRVRYLRYVDDKTQFYSKQLRIIKQKNIIESKFKEALLETINEAGLRNPEAFSMAQEAGLIPYDRRDIGDV